MASKEINSSDNPDMKQLFEALFPKASQYEMPDSHILALSDVDAIHSASGFSMWYNQIEIKEECEYQVVIPAGLHMSFCFGGQMQTTASSGERGDVSGFEQSLLYLEEDKTFSTFFAKQPPFIACGISLTEEFLNSGTLAATLAWQLIERMAGIFQISPLQTEIRKVFEGQSLAKVHGLNRVLVSEGIVMQLLGYWHSNAPDNTTCLPNANKVINIKKQVDRCESDWQCPSQLARSVGLSLQVFNQTFSQIYKQSLASYIRSRKLLLAQDLLQQGKHVSQVAYQLDLNPQYFSELFKKSFGQSPKAFQLKSRSNI